MNYSQSLFTVRIVINSKIYLYNTFTDRLIAISVEVDKLITQYKANILALKDIHPSLLNTLIQENFFVENKKDEWKEVFSKWETEDNSQEKLSLIINPTLDCNMRCWYCYEQHNKAAYMSDKTLQSINNLIERQTSNPILKGLNIDFFGGEPLLCYKKQVKPILEKAYVECQKQNKQLYVSFTTNGYLLSQKIVDDLNKFSYWGKVRLQITLDGNENLHNKVKSSGGIQPTYKKIVSNIMMCVRNNIKVLVRFNHTDENIDSYYDVIEDFAELTQNERDNISFAFHKVWQAADLANLKEKLKRVIKAFEDANFNVEISEPLRGTRCYADRQNFIVINYNGDLYKCTAREFAPNKREGILTDNGEIHWNNKFKKRMSLKECLPVCHRCVLYPLCHDGCTQNKLEASYQNDECPRKYTEEQKIKLLEEKLEHRLKNFKLD